MSNEHYLGKIEELLERLRINDMHLHNKCKLLYLFGCRVSELKSIRDTGVWSDTGEITFYQPKSKRYRVLRGLYDNQTDKIRLSLDLSMAITHDDRNGQELIKRLSRINIGENRHNTCTFHLFRYGYIARRLKEGYTVSSLAIDMQVSLAVLNGYIARLRATT
jgi:integrase